MTTPEETPMQPSFTRGFRVHLPGGRYLDGAEFPSGRSVLVDDPEYGFVTGAISVEELLKGYPGARVEWPGDQLVPTALLLGSVNHRHLTIDELAEREGVPKETIYAWNSRGVGPRYMKIGRHVRYRLADVIAWEDGRIVGPRSPADDAYTADHDEQDVAERAAEQEAARALARGETHL